MITTVVCALFIFLANYFPYPQWASKRLGTKFVAAFQAQHSARTGGKTVESVSLSILQTIWAVAKTQHMVIRLFFIEFVRGANPLLVLTGPMKVASVTVVLLMQAFVVTIYFTINSGQDPASHTTSTSLVVAVLAATLARPFLGVCDRWFRYCTVGYKKRLSYGHAWNELLFAGAAAYVAMDVVDLQCAVDTWLEAMDELRRMQLRSSRAPRLLEHLKLEVPISKESRVHKTYESVTSAIKALVHWRDAVIPLLRSGTSSALKRSQDRMQRNLYVRIARLELLAAPETLRLVDSDTLSRCSEAFELVDKLGKGVLSKIEILQACRRDPETRILFKLPRSISQETGSRDIFEAVMLALDVDKISSPGSSGSQPSSPISTNTMVSYDEFKCIFVGLSTAAEILTLGTAPPNAASADLARLLGKTHVARESQEGLFGVLPTHQQPGRATVGIGMVEGQVYNNRRSARSRVSLADEVLPAASFLRTPGPRRSMAMSMTADGALPASPPPSPPLSHTAVTLYDDSEPSAGLTLSDAQLGQQAADEVGEESEESEKSTKLEDTKVVGPKRVQRATTALVSSNNWLANAERETAAEVVEGDLVEWSKPTLSLPEAAL